MYAARAPGLARGRSSCVVPSARALRRRAWRADDDITPHPLALQYSAAAAPISADRMISGPRLIEMAQFIYWWSRKPSQA
eukprot:scaffold3697_cov55-Phaeocystis_antarctica.AAC.4